MASIQYTIRGIPSNVDKMIRKRSLREGKSFNATVVQLLETAVTGGKVPSESPDIFDRMFGAGTLDPEFDEVIKDLSKIDEDLWK